MEETKVVKKGKKQGSKKKYFKVTMPDGSVICEITAKDTYLAVIEELGFDRIWRLKIINNKRQKFVARVGEVKPEEQEKYWEVSGGWLVLRTNTIPDKERKLQKIAYELGINLKIEIFE